MDQRLVDLIVVFILWMAIFAVGPAFASIAKAAIDSGSKSAGCLTLLLGLPLVSATMATLGGTVIYMLWGIIAPVFGWPRIDLLTAVAISWLSAVLTRGFTNQKVEVTSLPKD